MPDTSTRNALDLPLSTDGGNTFYTGLHTSLETIDQAIAKGKWDATTAPTVDNDEDSGYAIGSIWVDVNNHEVYICEDPSAGEANWLRFNLQLDEVYLMVDGSHGLSANWDAGSFKVKAETFESDVATGTAPLVVASATKVTNLNVDKLDGADLSTAVCSETGSDEKVLTEQALRETIDQGILLTMTKNISVSEGRVVSFVVPYGNPKVLADGTYTTVVNTGGFLVVT